MTTPKADKRSSERRARHDLIAAEAPFVPSKLPTSAVVSLVETHLGRQHHGSMAVVGVMENGLVQPRDSSVVLPEHSRAIIVASGGT